MARGDGWRRREGRGDGGKWSRTGSSDHEVWNPLDGMRKTGGRGEWIWRKHFRIVVSLWRKEV